MVHTFRIYRNRWNRTARASAHTRTPAMVKTSWKPNEPFDYLWRHYDSSTLGPWTANDYVTAIARLPAAGAGVRAGLIYMQVNLWSPWTELLAQVAHANRAGVTVYFVGPRLPFDLSAMCPGCGWLPLDEEGIHRQLAPLGVRLTAGRRVGPRKLCDLKPLWPAMLPELSARHEWIGYADSDIIFGDLAAEVARLQPADELLTPAAFYPQPLSNGNFLLMRSVPKMLRAYERSADLAKMLAAFRYQGFDEWGLARRGSMMSVFQQMLFAGELVARPTSRLLIQDAIIVSGATFPMIDSFGANVTIEWAAGRLVAQRDGVCVCPDDAIPQFGLTVCDECLAKRGSVRTDVMLHRRLEILGFHFQEWKKRWRKREYLKVRQVALGLGGSSRSVPVSQRNRTLAALPLAALPSCSTERIAAVGFHVVARGFRCGSVLLRRPPSPSPLSTHTSKRSARFPPDWPEGADCASRLSPQLWGCREPQSGRRGRRGGAGGQLQEELSRDAAADAIVDA